MSAYVIRPAVREDIGAITSIYRECVLNGVATYELEPPDEAEMRSRYEAIRKWQMPYLLAEEDSEVMGYAYGSPFRTRPAYRWSIEDSIYCSPDARGRGIGRALLERLVSECETLGFRQIMAVIGGAEQASVAVHRAVGFDQCGMITGSGYKFGRWLDTVIMQKTLNGGTASDPDPNSYPGTLFS